MANVQLQLPMNFDFKKPDEWQRWRCHFEQFHSASGLSTADEERQISTLLGQDAEEVLASTGITTEQRGKYNDVIAKLDQFFKVRKNKTFERTRFNCQNQQEGESAEQYCT